jgi:hypothetical protein
MNICEASADETGPFAIPNHRVDDSLKNTNSMMYCLGKTCGPTFVISHRRARIVLPQSVPDMSRDCRPDPSLILDTCLEVFDLFRVQKEGVSAGREGYQCYEEPYKKGRTQGSITYLTLG